MYNKKYQIRITGIVIAILLMIIGVGAVYAENQNEGLPVVEIPKVQVKFGHGPYVDHSYAIIGLEKGWFEDVGIELLPKPYGKSSVAEDWGPLLISGAVDIQSSAVSHWLPSVKTAPFIRQFVWADLFAGFAILAQPDQGYKSYQEFLAEGLTSEESIVKSIQQMKGKTFTYPSESGIKGFIDTLFSRAGITLNDLNTIEVEDAKTVTLMLTKNADFQTSGAPARISLESAGMKRIIDAGELISGLKADENGKFPEDLLLLVFRDGWATTEKYYEENYDTILRMASVLYRIVDLIKNSEDEALNIQIPFVNSIAGTEMTIEEGRVIYNSLDPFFTFDEQNKWFFDKNDPFYYEYEVQAYINHWTEKGLFAEEEVTVEQLVKCDDIYKDLLKYKNETDELYKEIDTLIERAKVKNIDLTEVNKTIEQSKYYYDAYDFLDSQRFAEAVVNFLNKI
jgi:ABC-type nitrate/sulfonate/bicarbonate transport system substrate-binding protein